MINKGDDMRFLVIVSLVVLLLSGCATTKHWSATGGSRADGVVRLSYEHGEFEQPQLSEAEAVDLAIKRCKIWGYSGAEAFGGVTRQCNMFGGFGGCANWIVTKEYQCTTEQPQQAEYSKLYNERKAEIQAAENELTRLKSQLELYDGEIKKLKEQEYEKKYEAYLKLVQDSNDELKRIRNKVE